MNCTAWARSGASFRPVPKTFSRQLEASMTGVRVWSRTKKRSFGIVRPRSPAASQRISAFVGKTSNHSGGRGFWIGELPTSRAARAADGEATRAKPATTGSDAAPSIRSCRRESPCRRSSELSSCSPRVSK